MKIDIDNLFKEKLNRIEVDFKEEYWDEMKKKMAAGSGMSGSGFSNIISISLITLVSFSLGIVLYHPFGDAAKPGTDEHNKRTTMTKVLPVSSTKDVKQNMHPKRISDKECAKVDMPTMAHQLKVAEITAPSLNSFDIMAYLTEQNHHHTVVALNQQEIDNVDLDEYIIAYDITEESKTTFGNEPPEKKHADRPEKNNPKTFKPIEKPVKQVFKKKKGLLWYLGIRK